MIKKLLRKFTGWMVTKTNYTPELLLPIQPIIIKPEDLKKFHARRLVDWYEWKNAPLSPDCYIKELKYKVADELLKEIQIKAEETSDGVMYSCDLLFKSI